MKIAWRLVACALLGSAAQVGAAAPTNASLEEAKAHHRAFRFEACLGSLDTAAGDAPVSAVLAEIEIWRGLCALGLSRRSAAVDHFQTAVRIDPDASLPPFTSPKIRNLFQSATEGLRTQPSTPSSARAGSLDLAPPSATGTAASPGPDAVPPSSVAATAATPRGGLSPVTLAFGGGAAVGVGAYVFFGLRALQAEREANGAHFQSVNLQEGEHARSNARWANVSLAGAGACATGAVISYFISRSLQAEAP